MSVTIIACASITATVLVVWMYLNHTNQRNLDTLRANQALEEVKAAAVIHAIRLEEVKMIERSYSDQRGAAIKQYMKKHYGWDEA